MLNNLFCQDTLVNIVYHTQQQNLYPQEKPNATLRQQPRSNGRSGSNDRRRESVLSKTSSTTSRPRVHKEMERLAKENPDNPFFQYLPKKTNK